MSQSGKQERHIRGFSRFANGTAWITGQPLAFVASVTVVAVWAVTGPAFHYSDTWQLVINTGTTIITFLMVFLIQNTQNRDALAVQVKLDELVRAVANADNRIVGVEKLTEPEVEALHENIVARANNTSDGGHSL
jgi:low affinity Fe/Cu permease